MLVSIALFMASAASDPAAAQAELPASSFPSKASATATATIRVISGVRFGSAYPEGDRRGSRREAQLTDSAGNLHDAELLEFQ